MTSVVDKYYRQISENIDNIKMKFDISSLLVKSKEHDSKIDTNKTDISDNLGKIDTNTSVIDTHQTTLSNIDNDLVNLRGRINTHQTDIQNINTNINDNRNNISSNSSKINAIEENNLKISNEVFNNKYDIINLSFNFNSSIHSYKLFQKIIENDMINGELEINTNINYKYNNLQNDLKRLTHLYEFYDKNDNIFYTITLNHNDFGKVSDEDNNVLIIKDNFCFNIDNKDKIKVVLSLARVNDYGVGLIDLEMINNNSINIIYNEKTDISDKFNENDKRIKVIDDKLSTNNNLISNNFTSILPLKSNYVIDNILLFNLNFVKDINFLSNINRILVYETNIFYQFKPNSFIELNESIVYKYDNIKTSYYILKEKYIIMDQNDTILDEFSFNIKSKGFIFNNLHIFDNQYFFKLQSYITTLKLKVYLERINYDNEVEFNLQLNNEFQNNFIALKYFKYTL